MMPRPLLGTLEALKFWIGYIDLEKRKTIVLRYGWSRDLLYNTSHRESSFPNIDCCFKGYLRSAYLDDDTFLPNSVSEHRVARSQRSLRQTPFTGVPLVFAQLKMLNSLVFAY
ncbi:uncharacterized protein RSE6_06003 [Rhynchosporium secalis]|uniref:Uncharacterized protein n=1 Tax=Rhynchosporium secalis TaxID=38038 RepID=A0A1E1M995_RHYSE|nr:uncharacterized protein RSE6_06003 [Rhynchosporium secalis]